MTNLHIPDTGAESRRVAGNHKIQRPQDEG